MPLPGQVLSAHLEVDGQWSSQTKAALLPGPIEADSEWTILVPAVEKGNQMPEGAFEQAEQRRVEVIADPVNRRREVSDDDDG